ncbi:phage tail terminator protein [Virgibacillus alimentarius]|uniref:phage tail terminator protein n=1 Tax=Virgibacillus alimentarius TaxID=698769 RepID=UPI0004939381|nr:minor capsid protein [Virgibacillus alimentarius]
MIQKPLMRILEKEIPDLNWSINYRTADDHTGTVYSTGGSKPDKYDTNYRYPSYQVYIRSSDWDYAETLAHKVFDILHKKENFNVTTSYKRDGITLLDKRYHVFLITASSDILRVGVNKGVMEYSVNFDVDLIESKEETTNGTR